LKIDSEKRDRERRQWQVRERDRQRERSRADLKEDLWQRVTNEEEGLPVYETINSS
jgi:hypothetical protein